MAKDLFSVKNITRNYINEEVYVNRRNGVIKNAGCTIDLKNKRVAYIYAIVDSNGGVVVVKAVGRSVNKYFNKMESDLMDVLQKEEDTDEHPRFLYLNHQDSPLS